MDSESKNDILKNVESESTNMTIQQTPELAGYADLQKIADGATGIVYSALRLSDNRRVALKIYKKELIPNSDAAKRFQHEVQSLQRVSHPNIIEILDSGDTKSGHSFIAMELIDGVSIRTVLETDGVFEPRRAADITREICRTLRCLHAKGIIHRDIKPNNIILDTNNGVRIVDFGIAKVLDSSSDTLSQYGTILGTPAYMSPEQCLGQKVDERSDVYSVGCTLFEMITGLPAFASASSMEAVAKQIDDDRSFIEKPLVAAGAPANLRQIISKCICREPADRYKNIDELDHELNGFLLGAPLAFPASANSKKPDRKSNERKEHGADRTWQTIAYCVVFVVAIGLIKFNSDQITQSSNSYRPQSASGAPPGERGSIAPAPGTFGPYKILERDTRRVLFEDDKAFSMGNAIENAAQRGISLHRADLHGANLRVLHLSHADLSYADLSHAELDSACLTEVNLHGAILTDASMANTQLIRDDLSAAQLMNAKMRLVEAPETNFTGADLSFADLSDARCLQAKFQNANFTKANLAGTVFRLADLSFADFNNAYFKYRRFNFENANLAGVRNFPARGED
ncbi:MAG: serine/threonine-protein kinase [Candidatus Obscuribacterales bacterium]